MHQSQSGERLLYRLAAKEPARVLEYSKPLRRRRLHRLIEHAGEHAALAHLAADLQLTFVAQQNVFNNGQSQAGPTRTAIAAGFDPVEALREVGNVFTLKTRSVVLYRDVILDRKSTR